MKRRNFLRLTAMCGGAAVLDWSIKSGLVHAKDLYPSRKIAYIAHVQPGSGFDIIPRAMAPYIKKYLKQLSPGCNGGDIVIKNLPAAAGLMAYNTVLHAKPDGYTIGSLDIAFITDVLTGRVEFDMMKLTYLAKLNSTNKVVVAHKNGFKSWGEVLDYSKKAALRISVSQFGRPNHICGFILKDLFDLNAKFIPSPGTSGSMGMLIRGDVHAAIASDDSVSSLLEAKEIHVLLTFNDTDEYPSAVSMKQLGHPEAAVYGSSHRFIIAPTNLPKEIGTLLINALKGTMGDEEFKNRAKKMGFVLDPVYGDKAVTMAKDYIRLYQKIEPMLKKYLS